MRKQTKELHLTSYDELLGINEEKNYDTDSVIDVSLKQLFPFKNHPFRVCDDEKMEETVESIRKYGVLNPGIVRVRPEGGYELIAGHRRKRGCELAGIEKMPVIVRNYSDDEAVVIMVDSNIQRENILPSEKAFAYKMKLEALKHQGLKNENGTNEETADLVGKEAGDSGRKVQRFIRLTELIPELLEMVDQNKLKFIPAVAVSYLTKEEQNWVYQCIREKKASISGDMADKLKQYSASKTLTKLAVELILYGEKKESRKLTVSETIVNKYFPADYSKEQMEDVICMLLENWSKKEIQEG